MENIKNYGSPNNKRKREENDQLLFDRELIDPNRFQNQFHDLIRYTCSCIENDRFEHKCKKILQWTNPNQKENEDRPNREQYKKMKKHFIQNVVDFQQNANKLLQTVRLKVKGTKMDLLFHRLDQNHIVETKKVHKKCTSTLTGKPSQQLVTYEMAFVHE